MTTYNLSAALIRETIHLLRSSLAETLFSSLRNKFTGMIFFFSGISALIYQVVWQRLLTQAIGVDSVSIAVIVTIFMMGLGFGALAGGWVSGKCRRAVLPFMYAAIELLIGGFGIVSIPALRYVNAIGATLGYQSIVFDFTVNAVVLFLPIFLMGLTTPIVVELLKSNLENFGKTIGVFYGVNVVGAALGALAPLLLIELLGLNGTIFVAVTINVAIGVSFLVFTRMSRAFEASHETTLVANAGGGHGGTRHRFDPNLRVAAFIFGCVNLSMQMILFRVLVHYLSPGSFVFPTLLCVFLIMMATGQVLGGVWIDATSPSRRMDVLLYLLMLACLAILLVFHLPLNLLDLVVYDFMWLVGLPIYPVILAIAVIFMVPVVFFSAYLPSVSKIAAADIRFAGGTFGAILYWSTLGNIAGTFFTAFVLFQYLGTIYTVVIMAWVALGGVLLLVRRSPERQRLQQLVLLSSAAVLTLSFLIPKDYYYQPLGSSRPFVGYTGTSRPLNVLEGHTTITPVYFNEKTKARMEVRPFNAGAAAAIINEKSVFYRYFSLSVPQMIDQNFRPRRILLIGLGSGELPFVMKALKFVDKFVIAELSPEVLEAYERYSDPLIAQTLHHRKVEVHATDGRRYVQKALAKGEKFDFVQIGIIGLTLAGASNIYSLDFFKKVRQLINAGGYLALEPYIGVARLGFEIYPYGYVLGGSSWIFMHDHPLELRSGQNLSVPEYQMRHFMAKSYRDLLAELQPACLSDTIAITEYEREDVIRMFPKMVGTDDHLIFEYFYLSHLLDGYTPPTALIQGFKDLKSQQVTLNVRFGDCA